MNEAMTQYFSAEKSEALLFMIVGAVAIGLALWMWLSRSRLRSMAFPLVAIALIQITVGTSVFVRTDSQLAGLVSQLQRSPAEFKTAETTRMQVVMKNFEIYKIVEIGLLATGVGLLALRRRFQWATGLGCGLVGQCAFMLLLDFFAESRGREYVLALARLGA